MIVLVILLSVFLVCALVSRLIKGYWNFSFSGNLAMCIMLCFTGAGHFIMARGMEMMMPSFIPFKKELIFITGVLEIAAGIALLVPALRRSTALWLIIFFILILPTNIYAATINLDIRKADHTGPGLEYLWFRIPMQLLLIGWVYYFGIYRRKISGR